MPAERLPALSSVWAKRADAVHFKQMMELAADRVVVSR